MIALVSWGKGTYKRHRHVNCLARVFHLKGAPWGTAFRFPYRGGEVCLRLDEGDSFQEVNK